MEGERTLRPLAHQCLKPRSGDPPQTEEYGPTLGSVRWERHGGKGFYPYQFHQKSIMYITGVTSRTVFSGHPPRRHSNGRSDPRREGETDGSVRSCERRLRGKGGEEVTGTTRLRLNRHRPRGPGWGRGTVGKALVKTGRYINRGRPDNRGSPLPSRHGQWTDEYRTGFSSGLVMNLVFYLHFRQVRTVSKFLTDSRTIHRPSQDPGYLSSAYSGLGTKIP